MKTLLMLVVLMLVSPRFVLAEHLGIYRDATGESCSLDPGFNNTAVVMHRFSTGATLVHFRVDFSNAPGSTFVSFNSPYATVGSLPTDLWVAYGGCPNGNWVVGTITAILSPGYIEIAAPVGYPSTEYDDCNFQFLPIAGERAYIGSECPPTVATQQSTWGNVKALYR